MKVFVIGMDSVPPDLLFNKFLNKLPNLKKIIRYGIRGRIRSCDPPITIPAWLVMVTGKSPGKLGLYGFRHRKDNSYTDIWIANSESVKEPTIWDILSAYGKKSCIVGVTPTYPPKPLNGWLISGFITPDATKNYTYPPSLKLEIEKLVDEYIFDVKFRTDARAKLLEQLYEMTAKRFKVIRYLIDRKPWDFFMFVEIGLDRLHHAFWKYFDKQHHLYVPNSEYKTAILDYYKYFDSELGEILEILDNDTKILIVSDHGVKRMKGCICINEWLIREGFLVLKNGRLPSEATPLEKVNIDWAKTTAWGWGGYYARVFLNVRGREPQGKIGIEDKDKVLRELANKLKSIRGPNGEKLATKVYTPQKLFKDCNGDTPDLMVYFDNLYWRSAGTIGHNTIYLRENDTGPDDAVHSHYGVFVFSDPSSWDDRVTNRKLKTTVDILDIAPTILKLFDIEIPKDFEGKPLALLEDNSSNHYTTTCSNNMKNVSEAKNE